MGKCLFMRKGETHTAPIFGILASDLAVGSSVYLMENGVATEYLIVNQGKPSGSSLYDDSCDGTWLLRKELKENRQWHSSNVNDYKNSTIHAWLNGDFFNLFGSVEQPAIKQVKIPYRKNGGSSGTDQNGANGLTVKAFLLSGYEVGFTISDDAKFPTDGAKLDYFELGSSKSARIKRIATLNSKTSDWWLRSPYTGNTSRVWCIEEDGSSNWVSSTKSRGLRPAIILPSDMRVTDDMLLPANIKTMTMIGSYFGYGYVMVGDTKYSRAGEVFVEIGTAIVAHVGASDSTGAAGCKIYFNGTVVKTGTSSYSFTLKGNVQITFKRPDSSTSAIECYIVEQ